MHLLLLPPVARRAGPRLLLVEDEGAVPALPPITTWSPSGTVASVRSSVSGWMLTVVEDEAPLREAWKPWLEGRGTRDEALAALAARVALPR